MFFVWVSSVTGLTRYVAYEDTGWGRRAESALDAACGHSHGPAPLSGAPSLGQTASVPGVWSHCLVPPSLPGSPLPFTQGPVLTLAEVLSHGVCLEGGATQLFHSSLVLSQKSSL